MPPLPPRDLSIAEVKWLLRDSEGRKSVYRENEGAGHADARHYALTNEDLWARRDADRRSDKIALFTAFVSRAEMVLALRDTLNSPEGKAARHHFDQGGHNGMSAKVYHFGEQRMVRYAGGGGMMPVSDYVLIFARDDSRPLRLHVKTFYGTIFPATPERRVEFQNRGKASFSTGP